MIRQLTANSLGRDFVVGDIHGCFTLLHDKLEEIGFDHARDRLFSVGDLIDRGPESDDATTILHQPWFHAVRGNHEQMCIDGHISRDQRRLHQMNGGEFFYGMPLDKQQQMRAAFEKLPYVIEIVNEGKLPTIILHAECYKNSWTQTRALIRSHYDAAISQVIWGRQKIYARDTSHIDGAYQVYVGHTPVKDVMTLGNVHYIDTGAVHTGNLTILEIAK